MKKVETDPAFIPDTLNDLDPYMDTDFDRDQFIEFCELLSTCSLEPFAVIDGEAVSGDDYMEFYIDTQSRDALVEELFCQ